VSASELREIEPLREKYRKEMSCQIYHDSIHGRAGWTREFALHMNGAVIGYGSVAVAGTWRDQPAVYEFFVEPDTDAALRAFLNVANAMSNQMVFVLDDYHLIDDPAIHQALTFLLDHLPPTLHFALATRVQPPLPLARYRARHELLELGANDLQFALDETASFLNHLMRLDLGDEELAALHRRLEGWAAGLQLAALSQQGRSTAGEAPVISGQHRFIADYLAEDVLASLPERLRRFLLQTSILDRLAKRGLITRTVGATDRRTFVVRLTAKGQKLAKRVQRHLSALERAVARRVNAADIRAFKKVVAVLEQEAHERVGFTRTRATRKRKKAAS
jgi:ATP/maltotriose-dependent transcriptional regulator MalT